MIASVNRHEFAWNWPTKGPVWPPPGSEAACWAGNEVEFSALPFLGVFKEAQHSGQKLTLHAGEWAGADNVYEALETFNTDRIGHGVRMMENPNTVALARESGLAFEVVVTSNYQTGVVKSILEHPFMEMLNGGLNLAIGTDNPSILRVPLTDEYHLIFGKTWKWSTNSSKNASWRQDTPVFCRKPITMN